MFDALSSRVCSKFQTVGRRSVLAIGLYILGLFIHLGINRWMHRAMANDGLVFWSAAGTVIAAVIASIYGSSYAFELNRQKDLAAQRKANLEAGRWALVVLAVQATYLMNLSKHIYGDMPSKHWRLLMKSISSFDEVPSPNISELRFLVHQGKDALNYLITAANDSSVVDAKNINVQRNDFKERSKAKYDSYLIDHPEDLQKTEADESEDEFVEKFVKAIGLPLAYQISELSQQLLTSCELGVRNTIKLYDDLENLLRIEFPEVEFKGLNKGEMEKHLGRKLWD